MASKTKATEMKRSHRNARMGKKRKANLENTGSTKSAKELFKD